MFYNLSLEPIYHCFSLILLATRTNSLQNGRGLREDVNTEAGTVGAVVGYHTLSRMKA